MRTSKNATGGNWPFTVPSNYIHPKFLWGVGTSSYQTEGGISNNDWNYFTTSASIRKRISSLTTPTIFYRHQALTITTGWTCCKILGEQILCEGF